MQSRPREAVVGAQVYVGEKKSSCRAPDFDRIRHLFGSNFDFIVTAFRDLQCSPLNHMVAPCVEFPLSGLLFVGNIIFPN